MYVSVREDDFSVDAENSRLRERAAAVNADAIGAMVNFVGVVRQIPQGNESLQLMELEHYPGMTETSIRDVMGRAAQRWSLSAATVIHRVGTLAVNDQIVYVGVASAHRQTAFDACAFIMDFLKSEAPFWKKEHFESGKTAWVEARSSDVKALEKWTEKSS